MERQSTKSSSWKNLGQYWLPILISLIFLVFTFAYYPFQEKLQFDTDEGLNLMRSMLVTLGHPLYSAVSSDQPPLFNMILALVFRLVGFDVNAARLLVLLFSTLLVWACAQFLELTWGKLAAILFLPLIVMVPRYLNLSVAVMIGVPAIALAAVSMVFVTVWHQKRGNLWLVLSGFLLALSVLIKLFTGFLAPIFLIGMTLAAYLDQRDERFSWRIFRPALVWSASFAGLGLLLGLALIGPRNVWEIIYPHLMAPSEQYFQDEGFGINFQLQAAIPLIVLGLLGAITTVYRRNWLSLYPLVWAAVAYIMFSFYSPVFYHHQLLITVPLAMLAAATVGDGILSLVRAVRSSHVFRLEAVWGVIAITSFLLVSFSYFPGLNKELLDRPRFRASGLDATSGKLRVIDKMNEYSSQTHWIVTDLPMYAFRVHKPVPPILATISQKRLSTGSLTEADILSAMEEYKPEQVLMARFTLPALEDYLTKNYTLIYSPEYFRLFLRNDLKAPTQ
jgi:4-amino-4-deoxy-L-arabinose transferase-like glycosyltransferase